MDAREDALAKQQPAPLKRSTLHTQRVLCVCIGGPPRQRGEAARRNFDELSTVQTP